MHTPNWRRVSQVKVKVILRPRVKHPSGTRDQFLFLHEILFRQLQVCYFVASSLTRERVCNLLLLLGLARAVPLGSLVTHIYNCYTRALKLSH
jgi:hypothetical protein